MQHFRVNLSFALTVMVAGSLGAQGGKPLPLKYVGPPTRADITAGDLMTRLYKYADDSMMGRSVGTAYHLKAVSYIESEVRRMGLKPGGTNGSYYQDFPIFSRQLDVSSTLVAGGNSLKLGVDFVALANRPVKQYVNVPVVYVGFLADTSSLLDSAAVAGKLLLIRTGVSPNRADQQIIVKSPVYVANMRARAGAAGFVQVQDSLSRSLANLFMAPQLSMNQSLAGVEGPPTLIVSSSGAEAILGVPLASATRGLVGKSVTTDIRYTVANAPPGRNVIAILPGSDEKLKGQYVAIGGHSDHVGFSQGSRGESDSLKIWGAVAHPAGAEGGRNTVTNPITPAEWAKINVDIAALRKVYPARADSIANGADDDGTGSVSVLEIAEAFALGKVKPKRSIIFVWHAGEEAGMWGSGYFMDNPTIPRDSLVAQLNIDMVGRGEATDVTGQAKGGGELHGNPHYVQLVGSRRLSTELGDLVEKVNADKKHGILFDYNIDADGHPQNIYCRSDHWSYGKWGVPVVFFTTGGHADYHQVTDEPQYIQYDHMAAIDKLVFDVAVATANLDHRVVVDKAKPNPAPATVCKQ